MKPRAFWLYAKSQSADNTRLCSTGILKKLCSSATFRLAAVPLLVRPFFLSHTKLFRFRRPPIADHCAAPKATRSAPASKLMRFCSFRLKPPLKSSLPTVPFQRFSLSNPPSASKSSL